MTFVEARGARDFAGPPGQRFYAGACFCFWQDGARSLGTVMWGRPLESDVEAMIPFFEVGADSRFRGHASFVDCRGIQSIDVLAFAKLLAYLARRQHAWGPHIGRQAILHPDGLVGAMVAGALHVVQPPYRFACFKGEAASAFTWAGVPEVHPEVEALRASLIRAPEIIVRLQSTLHQRGLLDADEAAHALGLSRRTLQRRLRESGTTFRELRDRHVSLEIERLLSGTDLDLDAIAASVGLSSGAYVAAFFRSRHGMTPGAWRAKIARRTAESALAGGDDVRRHDD